MTCVEPNTNSAGTKRRLRALAVNGWGPEALATELRHLGARMTAREVWALMTATRRIPAGTALTVCQLYDALWKRTPPQTTPAEQAAAARTRARARRGRWAPIGAWDEEPGPHWIDDPAAVPVPGSWPWRRGRYTFTELQSEITFLAEAGYSFHEALARLNMTDRSFYRVRVTAERSLLSA